MSHGKFSDRRSKFWAGGFLFDAQARKVLLHRRDDQTPFNPNRWAFFGGLNEGNESFGECFVRELREETGLQLEPDRVTYLRDYAHTTVAQHRAVILRAVRRALRAAYARRGCWTRLDCFGRYFQTRSYGGDQSGCRIFPRAPGPGRPSVPITHCSREGGIPAGHQRTDCALEGVWELAARVSRTGARAP